MKKTKLERKINTQKMGILEVDWQNFKSVVEDRVSDLSSLGYNSPRICHDEYSVWLEMTKVEDDESYQKRLADSEKSEIVRFAQRIEKLKKETKELGLEIKQKTRL